MLGQALGEKHPDRDAVAGGRVVVAGGVADEEDATFGDGCALADESAPAPSGPETNSASRSAGTASARGRRVVRAVTGGRDRWRQDRHEQQVGSDRCLVPLVAVRRG